MESYCCILTQRQQQIVDSPLEITRNRNRWSMNEINRLYNEYEIKELTIRQIAKLHNRSYKSILHQLTKEGLILPNWSDARGNYEMTDSPDDLMSP
jgi:predicted transcriptional regulator